MLHGSCKVAVSLQLGDTSCNGEHTWWGASFEIRWRQAEYSHHLQESGVEGSHRIQRLLRCLIDMRYT